MACKKTTSQATPHDAFTLTHHSTCIKDGFMMETPGQCFRSLVAVCLYFIPVADIVTNSDCPVNDVVVLPPLPKRAKHNTNTTETKPNGDINDVILPAEFAAATAAAATAALFTDQIDDVSEDDSSDMSSAGCCDDDQKLPACKDSGRMAAIPKGKADEDNGDNTYFEEDTFNKDEFHEAMFEEEDDDHDDEFEEEKLKMR